MKPEFDPKQQKAVKQATDDVKNALEAAGIEAGRVNKVIEQIRKNFEEAAASSRKFTQTVQDTYEQIDDIVSAEKEAAAERKNHAKQQLTDLRAQLKAKKLLREIDDDYKQTAGDILEIQKDFTSNLQAALKYDTQSLSVARDQIDLAREAAITAVEHERISREQFDADMANLDAMEKQLTAADNLRNTLGETNVDNIKEGFDAAGSSIETLTGGLINAETASNLIAKGAEMLGPGFMAALGPIILIIGAIKKLYDMIGEINAQTREFSSQTGLSFQQSEKLVKSSMALATSNDNIMSTQKEILAVQGALVQQFGTADAVSQKTVQSLSNMSKVLGISEQNAAGVQQVLMQNAGASEDAALGIQQMGAGLAEAYGVPINDVMQDLADSGEEVAKYFAGMPKEAMKTAVQLKAMGLNMKTAAKVADGLLDIESSIKAETKAQIMLGKSINLDNARQLAAQGKIAQAAAAATKEIGTAAEFAKMDQFQKKAAAEAAGLTLEELSKTYAMQEKMANMSEEQKALVEQYGDKLGDVTQMDEAQLKAKATALQQQEKFAASMENLKTSLMEGLMPVFEALGPVFSVLGTTLKNIMTLLKPIFNIISNIFGGIKDVFGGIIKMINGDFMGGLKQMVGGIARIVLWPFQLITDTVVALINVFVNGLNELGQYVGFSIPSVQSPDLTSMVMGAFDDAVIPPTGQAGAGYSRVLSGPEGSVALNDKDTIVAGTNLGGGGGGSMDISPLVAAVQQTNALLAQMIKSPSPVLIGDEALRKIGRNVKVQNSRGA